ncbi:hypothetical protein [Crinalium epipsammum]|uniref:hypothetical protein n=1 Tax=Crinalium epipsammum TaxID=241425 RepID=UPI0012FC21BD|nr:hypothetical protein [Crinalium epipsammum]
MTNKAPKNLREAMLQMARNMELETKAFFTPPYSVTLDEKANCVGYLIYDTKQGDDQEMHAYIVGAACFRLRNEEDKNAHWALQWVWIFPSYRNHGMFDHIKGYRNSNLMNQAWQVFEEYHPDFIVEPPYTKAMRAFLRKSPERMKRCPDARWLLDG